MAEYRAGNAEERVVDIALDSDYLTASALPLDGLSWLAASANV
jgi:hypothetical protein